MRIKAEKESPPLTVSQMGQEDKHRQQPGVGPAPSIIESSPQMTQFQAFTAIANGRQPVQRRPIPSDQNLVAQLMTLKILNPGDAEELKGNEDPDMVRRVGVLNVEQPNLQQAYGEDGARIISISDKNLPLLKQKGKDLKAIGDEVLVINAHGSNGRVAGRTPAEFVTLLNDIGATGYREIHLYACQSGMAIFDFDREVSARLHTKVWAPRGNTTFNTEMGKYIVKQMTYSGKDKKFVPDGDKVFAEDEGWWCLQDGHVVALGSPTTPHAFPKIATDNFDPKDWGISLVTSDDE
jgi:hypothetical protein